MKSEGLSASVVIVTSKAIGERADGQPWHSRTNKLPALINTVLQRGETKGRTNHNRFSGLYRARKPLKRFCVFSFASGTQLKQGVNEIQA
jgi:hypothetical protein